MPCRASSALLAARLLLRQPAPLPEPASLPRVAEEGISLCRKMKLAPDDETLAGFEAMQAELQAMQEGQIKAQKAAEAGKGGAAAEAK